MGHRVVRGSEPMALTHLQEANAMAFLNALNDGDGVAEASAFLVAGGKIDAVIVPFIEQTMLHYAAIHRHAQLIEFLARRGAELNVRNAQGMTALHLAITHEINAIMLKKQDPDFPIARQLIELGALPDIEDDNGRTPRGVAELYGQLMLDLFDEAVK
jgi:hypothetical protein